MEIAPEHEYLRDTLKTMTDALEETTKKVNEAGYPEYTDFHARRLVEIAGYTIIGYLLLQDAQKAERFVKGEVEDEAAALKQTFRFQFISRHMA